MLTELSDAFEQWRRECESFEKEMGKIVGGLFSISRDERQAQFVALIERRNEAARKFLGARSANRTNRRFDQIGKRLDPYLPPDVPREISAPTQDKGERSPSAHVNDSVREIGRLMNTEREGG